MLIDLNARFKFDTKLSFSVEFVYNRYYFMERKHDFHVH